MTTRDPMIGEVRARVRCLCSCGDRRARPRLYDCRMVTWDGSRWNYVLNERGLSDVILAVNTMETPDGGVVPPMTIVMLDALPSRVRKASVGFAYADGGIMV